jgi:hypothetical protein
MALELGTRRKPETFGATVGFAHPRTRVGLCPPPFEMTDVQVAEKSMPAQRPLVCPLFDNLPVPDDNDRAG